MSVVFAVKKGDSIYLGTDSQVSYGGNKRLITSPTSFKLWRPKGHNHLVIGGTGALRDLNILSTVDVWFDEIQVSGAEQIPFELDFAYVVREIAPSIRAEVAKYSGSDEPSQSSFLFAYRNKCYEISPCGAVSELSFDGDFTAIGSGGDITKAVYSAIEDLDLPLKEKMIRALAQACEDDLYVSYPIIFMDTYSSSGMEVFDGEYLHLSAEKIIHFDDLGEYYAPVSTEEDEELIEEMEKEFGDVIRERTLEVEEGTEEDKIELLTESQS